MATLFIKLHKAAEFSGAAVEGPQASFTNWSYPKEKETFFYLHPVVLQLEARQPLKLGSIIS